LSPAGDDSITDGSDSPTPTARYQHAMVYVPETTSLYIYGGLTLDPNTGNWIGVTDLWQLNLFPNIPALTDPTIELPPLKWKRICKDCASALPASNFAIKPGRTEGPGYNISNPPPVVSMLWNKPQGKMFLYWINGTSVWTFDPLAPDVGLSFQQVAPASHANDLSGSAQTVFNQRQGRTYGYNKGSPFTQTVIFPTLNFWDMDSGDKAYLRSRFNLGAPSKIWAQVLTPIVKGYGQANFVDGCTVDTCGGISVYIYNYDTSTWDIVGSNNAANDTAAWNTTIQAEIIQSFFGTDAQSHVSVDGYVDILVFPNGNPTKYHQLMVDQIFLDGVF
jgi:hypothetical protein